MAQYAVIVSNVGTVLTTTAPAEALDTFEHYVKLSQSGVGRSGNEDVFLMEDGDIAREYNSPEKDPE